MWGDMYMKKFCLIFAVFLILVVSGCKKDDEMSKKDIVQRASDVAVEYIRVKKDKDFVVKDAEFSSATNSSIVFVYGYYKPEKDKEVVLMVDSADDYKITGVGSN